MPTPIIPGKKTSEVALKSYAQLSDDARLPVSNKEGDSRTDAAILVHDLAPASHVDSPTAHADIRQELATKRGLEVLDRSTTTFSQLRTKVLAYDRVVAISPETGYGISLVLNATRMTAEPNTNYVRCIRYGIGGSKPQKVVYSGTDGQLLSEGTVTAEEILTDAPSDDKEYNRKNGAWHEAVTGEDVAALITAHNTDSESHADIREAMEGKVGEAPTDGREYVRKSGTWEPYFAYKIVNYNVSTFAEVTGAVSGGHMLMLGNVTGFDGRYFVVTDIEEPENAVKLTCFGVGESPVCFAATITSAGAWSMSEVKQLGEGGGGEGGVFVVTKNVTTYAELQAAIAAKKAIFLDGASFQSGRSGLYPASTNIYGEPAIPEGKIGVELVTGQGKGSTSTVYPYFYRYAVGTDDAWVDVGWFKGMVLPSYRENGSRYILDGDIDSGCYWQAVVSKNLNLMQGNYEAGHPSFIAMGDSTTPWSVQLGARTDIVEYGVTTWDDFMAMYARGGHLLLRPPASTRPEYISRLFTVVKVMGLDGDSVWFTAVGSADDGDEFSLLKVTARLNKTNTWEAYTENEIGGSGGIPEAPRDRTEYVRMDAGWHHADKDLVVKNKSLHEAPEAATYTALEADKGKLVNFQGFPASSTSLTITVPEGINRIGFMLKLPADNTMGAISVVDGEGVEYDVVDASKPTVFNDGATISIWFTAGQVRYGDSSATGGSSQGLEVLDSSSTTFAQLRTKYLANDRMLAVSAESGYGMVFVLNVTRATAEPYTVYVRGIRYAVNGSKPQKVVYSGTDDRNISEGTASVETILTDAPATGGEYVRELGQWVTPAYIGTNEISEASASDIRTLNNVITYEGNADINITGLGPRGSCVRIIKTVSDFFTVSHDSNFTLDFGAGYSVTVTAAESYKCRLRFFGTEAIIIRSETASREYLVIGADISSMDIVSGDAGDYLVCGVVLHDTSHNFEISGSFDCCEVDENAEYLEGRQWHVQFAGKMLTARQFGGGMVMMTGHYSDPSLEDFVFKMGQKGNVVLAGIGPSSEMITPSPSTRLTFTNVQLVVTNYQSGAVHQYEKKVSGIVMDEVVETYGAGDHVTYYAAGAEEL